MNPIFTKMVDAVEAANAAPDDYIHSADGLKYCGKCYTPKETFFPADLQAQGFTKHPVMCKCAAERREREEAERRKYERMSYMTMLRSEAFRDMPAAGWRFESATVTTPQHPSLQRREATRRTGTSSKKRGSDCSCSGMSARENPMPLAALPTL